MPPNTQTSGSSGDLFSAQAPGAAIGPEALSPEVALQKDDAQLQFIIDSSPHAIFVKDLQGRFFQINRALEKVLGLPREKIIGHTIEGMFPPEVAAAFQAQDLQALISSDGVEIETTFERGDPRHWYRVHKFPLRDAFGRIYAIFGFVTDVTDRKRAEEALQSSEEKFRQLAENIREVFWITDPGKQQMLYISPASRGNDWPAGRRHRA